LLFKHDGALHGDDRILSGRSAGAGSRPDVGRAAAEEVLDEISAHLSGVQMLFVTAGMGGGTGSGASPVIARTAREMGILTVGVAISRANGGCGSPSKALPNCGAWSTR
jgi:cell division GTPase FtsZ